MHQFEDGSTHIWSSRRHRKGFGREVVTPAGEPRAKQRPALFLWAPDKLNWWIAALFMIGSSCFVLGSVLFLAGVENYSLIGLIFFIGSIFFTSAGYSQYNQSINATTAAGVGRATAQRIWLAWQPDSLDFWVTFSKRTQRVRMELIPKKYRGLFDIKRNWKSVKA